MDGTASKLCQTRRTSKPEGLLLSNLKRGSARIYCQASYSQLAIAVARFYLKVEVQFRSETKLVNLVRFETWAQLTKKGFRNCQREALRHLSFQLSTFDFRITRRSSPQRLSSNLGLSSRWLMCWKQAPG